MSDEQYHIMDVVVDDAPDNTTPKQVKGMLQDMRRFVNEHDPCPTMREFNEWSGAEYSSEKLAGRFGNWNNGVEAVGGEPNPYQKPRLEGYRKNELIFALNEAVNQEIEYEVDGEEKVSPEGVAPAANDLEHIDSIEWLPDTLAPFPPNFGKPYKEVVREVTVGKPVSDVIQYDRDDVKETLKHEIQSYTHWEARKRDIPSGQIPQDDYINQHEDLPHADTLRDWFGSRENWHEKTGAKKSRNANDLNFDRGYFE